MLSEEEQEQLLSDVRLWLVEKGLSDSISLDTHGIDYDELIGMTAANALIIFGCSEAAAHRLVAKVNGLRLKRQSNEEDEPGEASAAMAASPAFLGTTSTAESALARASMVLHGVAPSGRAAERTGEGGRKGRRPYT